jgi:hypothetical protein
MVIFALGGPVGGLVFAVLVAMAAADSELPLIVRLPLGGVVAASIAVQLVNLVPGATRTGALTDGALALQWAFRPASQLERVRLARDVETYRTDRGKVAGDPGLSDEEFEQLRGTLGDPRNQIASVAIGRMLIWLVASVRAFEGETDPALSDFARRARATAPEVGNFAARAEPPLNLRSSAAVTMAYVLIWLYLKELAGSPADPTSPQMVQLVALAEQAWRLQPEKQVTRNALGLARLLQNRPADTRALLMNMADNGEAIDEEVRSDADAIRGLAECELGDLAQAQRLLASARRRTVQSDYVDWLDTAIRRRSGQAEIRPH